MHHVSLVAVVDGVYDLPERLTSVRLRHASVLGDVIYKHTALISANERVKVDYQDPYLFVKRLINQQNITGTRTIIRKRHPAAGTYKR